MSYSKNILNLTQTKTTYLLCNFISNQQKKNIKSSDAKQIPTKKDA
jgi:hypothetical protein